MTKNDLKERSRQLSVPFSSVLAAYVFEELLCQIFQSAFAENLWLKDDGMFDYAQFKKKNILLLDFVYLKDSKMEEKEEAVLGKPLTKKLAYMMLLAFLGDGEKTLVKWSGKADIETNCVKLEIIGEFEEMRVPITVRLKERTMEDGWIADKKTRKLLVETDREITYFGYPMELLLVEQLFSMLKDMELITNLDFYFRVYQALLEYPINGRHIREGLFELCEERHLPREESRVEELLAYRNYTYMNKRWGKYIRYCGKTEPVWEEVVDKLSAFLPPIWQAVCRDEVFFGDWMPELGRFLD